MEFIATYTEAKTVSQKIKCIIAKILHAKVVTPLGRIMLLHEEYKRLAIETGNEDLL